MQGEMNNPELAGALEQLVLDNPELELAQNLSAADAVLSYRFDAASGDHILRLLDPVADHQHIQTHHPAD